MSEVEAEKRLDAQKQREKLAREQRRADWKTLLESPAGRRSLALLVFEFGGLEAQAHNPDPYQRSFNDGQRQVAIEINRELMLCDRNGWALMHAERLERLRLEPDAVQETDQ